MSFFKSIAVSYYTDSVYNSGTDLIKAEISRNFDQALVDVASNYVCAVERLEISSNAIPFYSVPDDPYSAPNSDYNQEDYNRINIYWRGGVNNNVVVTNCFISGIYYSLADLIYDMNLSFKVAQGGDSLQFTDGTWSLDRSGCIVFELISNSTYGASLSGYILTTSSPTLSSIFGIPYYTLNPTITATEWWSLYSQMDYAYIASNGLKGQRFKTKYSRIDTGNIPALIQLRSNLPLESDQVNQGKNNIVTDFSLTGASTVSQNYLTTATLINANVWPAYYNDQDASYGWGVNTNGMIVYVPNERRWLNFTAPTSVFNIDIWAEYVLNDGTSYQIMLPTGCKFSIKLGLYLRD